MQARCPGMLLVGPGHIIAGACTPQTPISSTTLRAAGRPSVSSSTWTATTSLSCQHAWRAVPACGCTQCSSPRVSVHARAEGGEYRSHRFTWSQPDSPFFLPALENVDGPPSPGSPAAAADLQQEINAQSLEKVRQYYRKLRYYRKLGAPEGGAVFYHSCVHSSPCTSRPISQIKKLET